MARGAAPRASLRPRARAAGLSYSGLAAAYVGLAAPRRFTRIVAQSGSFWWNDCWLERQLSRLATRSAPSFYLSVGRRETQSNLRHHEDVLQTVSQREAVSRFHAALRRHGCSALIADFPGGHGPAGWRQDLPHALHHALPPPVAAR